MLQNELLSSLHTSPYQLLAKKLGIHLNISLFLTLPSQLSHPNIFRIQSLLAISAATSGSIALNLSIALSLALTISYQQQPQ